MNLGDLSYFSIQTVVDSWESLKSVPHYEDIVGVKLLQCLFINCPETRFLFNVPFDMVMDTETVRGDKRIVMHATTMLRNFDMALGLLGSDFALVENSMKELGSMHQRMGVQPYMFDALGDALLSTLEDVLEMAPDVKRSWIEVYGVLSHTMVAAEAKPVW